MGVTYRFSSDANKALFAAAPEKYMPQFGGQSSRDDFEMDPVTNLNYAHQLWNTEVAGSNAVLQRYQRLIFRVPHYKSGAQLKAEYAAKLDSRTLPVMPGAAQVVPQQSSVKARFTSRRLKVIQRDLG